ncbi:MAG: sodium-dependent transporter [Clostridiales bacterium]|nr:sodium-dependent transporter [Clostridiales bacterium]
MKNNQSSKNGFISGIGFILAAAGSAVGLGNLWAFPYKTSANGGAAFVLVYIICVALVGSIAMISEIYLGKRAQANPVTAYKKIKRPLGFIGIVVILIPTLITCYYCVLGGWTLRYAVNSFQSIPSANNAVTFAPFVSNVFEPLFYTVIFLILAALIIMGGIKDGIEKSSKILMPALFIILIFIVIYCLCLGDGVKGGLEFYLKPDFSALGFSGIIAAMGQAFFSLSLGMGAMIAYGSYTGENIKVGKSAVMICIFDTLVAFLAGLAIFPAISALSPENLGANAQGPGLIYQILPKVFDKMGGIGQVLSFAFFSMVIIAALTSVISILEVSVQFISQKFKTNRKKTTLIMAIVCGLCSIPITWSVGGAYGGKIVVFGFDLLTFLDEIANTVLMPVGAFFACFSIGWLIDKKPTVNPMKTLNALKNDGLDLGAFSKIFVIMVKFVTPLLILLVEIMGVIGKLQSYGNIYWSIIITSLLLIAICVIVFFAFFYKKDCGTNADEIN